MLTWFEWLEHSWLGTSVNNSLWAFAAIEAGHLLALAVLGGAILVVDLPDASKLPALVEPWMLLFQADIKMRPFMTPDDLKRAGLDELGKKWS